jgi:TonB family protein
MQFLSLEEPVERPAVRVSRAEAVLLSLGAHLLVLLLFLFAPGMASRLLPEPILAFVRARPPLAEAREAAPPAVPPAEAARPESRKIPLRFAYVRTPDDNAVDQNPEARLLSDKSRRSRQEVPTPPRVREFSIDPHSTGDTIERVRPDPRLAAGRDSLDPAKPRPAERGDEAEAIPPVPAAGVRLEQAGEGTPPDGGGVPVATAVEGDGRASAARPGAGTQAGPAPDGDSGPSGDPRMSAGTGLLSAAARASLQRALSGEGEESKRLFDNPGYLSPGMATGTMSFDTQGFPWGDYARRVRIIIQNHWEDRLPLAFRGGVKGYACLHFVIQKDGTISDIQVERPSSVPPFTRAAVDAVRASSPLPPLPRDFPEDREGSSWCFFYNLLPQEVRDLLREPE